MDATIQGSVANIGKNYGLSPTVASGPVGVPVLWPLFSCGHSSLVATLLVWPAVWLPLGQDLAVVQ